MQRLSIIVVGGGASGVLLAAQLLRERRDVRVTLIERREQLGRGVAYSARQWDHLLNVPASGMSAFADDPDHFLRWLAERRMVAEGERFVFLPRRVYGTYLADVLADGQDERLNVIHAGCTALKVGAHGVEASLDNGTSLIGHVAVLAVGHEENAPRARGIAVRVGSDADTPLDPEAEVMILGSGLSMVDAWLSLSQAEHRGPITVVSRHGLLPQGHKEVERIELEAADVPFGTELRYFTDWFRDFVDEVEQRGGDWRSAVDALRPFNQRIWQSWSLGARKRFLEHVRPFWNIHRHRLPPELHERMRAAVASGQVRLVAGKFIDVARRDGRVEARVRRRGMANEEAYRVDRVYDCGGVTVDVGQSSNPVVRALVETGAARPDRLHIGLDVTPDCAVVDAQGEASTRLYAVGPLTRGQFFEIEAVPDIRLQVAALAQRLLAR